MARRYWTDTDHQTMRAVDAYLNDRSLTLAEIGALRVYLAEWIAEPWHGPRVAEALVAGLRTSVWHLNSAPAIRTWLRMAEVAGVDPPV